MIIQELCHYYDRLRDNPDIGISEPGFSREKIHAEIVLDRNGNLLQFNDLRIQKGKKLVPKEMIVPQANKRSGQKAYENPNFLWDNTAFVLGADSSNDPKTILKFECFKRLHEDLYKETSDCNLKALCSFFDRWNSKNADQLNNWEELEGGNIIFRFDGEKVYFHEKQSLCDIWLKHHNSRPQHKKSYCLVSGLCQSIARIHPDIKNVRGAQPKGAAIISFNADSYESYGKEQNYNAPVGEHAVFAYTTALNHLLNADSLQKIQIGDATTVFWTERQSAIEGMFGQIIDPKDAELSDNVNLKLFLEAVRDGKKTQDIEQDVKFYVLGLSPNNARIAVRFWYVCTVGQIETRLGQHLKDLQIIKSRDADPEFPGIWRLLNETVNKKSNDKTPQPLLAGSVMRSILEGTIYPQGLQNAVINRIRADQDINYFRAAILKAILNRKNRIYKNSNFKEINMSLDKENKNPAYLLGRLFAVLEKLQQAAIPGANATIKDRFFGSASATPASVFPQLLRLAQHHIDKSEYGKIYDKQIEEIVCGIKDFPAHMTLDQQGLFAISYYQQRQVLWARKEKEENK
jgi:CRISPR-associated protein Csd1